MGLWHWFCGLKLRWRIPLGLLALLAAVGGLYVALAYVRYRQCRHVDLLAVVPPQLPVVVRCRHGGAEWDRIRETDVGRAVQAQIERRGPLVEWLEAATGKSWSDLTAPLTAGPAANLSEARWRGLFGTDVAAGLEPSAGPFFPRAVFLTRIGFLECLAYPFVRRVAARTFDKTFARDPYRGVDVYSCAGVRIGPASPPNGHTVAFAVRGDILIVASDPDLVTDAIDRTFLGPSSDEGESKVPPWELREDAAVAIGVDVHRLSDKAPAKRTLRDLLQTFPVREILYGFDPDALERCTIALDVRPGQVWADGAVALRRGGPPLAPVSPAGAGPGTLLTAIPDHAVAFVAHRGSFDAFWQLFERVSLDAQRGVVAEEAIGGTWKFFVNQARPELQALRSAGLDTHLLPHLRAGPAFVLTKESGPEPIRMDEPPLETLVGLVEVLSGGDAAETSLHELLQRRAAPLVTQRPGEVQETLEAVGAESVHVLRRRGPPMVQFVYGEARGVLAFGVRPDAVARDHETLLGMRPGAIRGPRFRAVCQALDRAEPAEGRFPPDVLTLAFADLPRVRAMIAGMAERMARFAQGKIDAPELRRALERKNLRQPGEGDGAYMERIDRLVAKEVQTILQAARERIERSVKPLDPFSAAGMDVSVEKNGYRVRGVLLMQ